MTFSDWWRQDGMNEPVDELRRAYEAGQASGDAELAGVRAEVERLRAALQEIADAPDDTHEVDPNGEHYHDCGPCRAREALATPPTAGKP